MPAVLTVLLLAVPTVLAFATGGYGALAQARGGLAVWLIAMGALLAVRDAPPRGRIALLALGGLAGLTVWTFASAAWAPVVEDAWAAGRLALLYLGAMT